MPDAEPKITSERDTIRRTLLVAFLVSLLCSSLVASAAVLLKPRQEANEARHMRRNIVDVAGLLESGQEFEELLGHIETRVVDLQTGSYVDHVDELRFDPVKAARDPALSLAIPEELDAAGIGRRSKWGSVYLVRKGGVLETIVLPVRGRGLWSMIYGLLAVEPDANTIVGITFYEHGETPGLGDQISKRPWRDSWSGKQLFDESNDLKIEVVKGRVPPDSPLAPYHVDGISGATLTGRGVTSALQYWLGDHGYGPYLQRIRSQPEGS
ncbi:MAG: Na(+)-translocating NADH-quinone reductase subunit C [Myxococcales bacterium]|nr:Na(+)-translocating NADH-quinone reductase subunit C [Myxococcales bacterium]